MLSSLLTNDTMIVFSCIQRFRPRIVMTFLQIIYGTEDSILQQPNSIGHCISADTRMGKGFADFLSHRIPGLRSTCRKAKLFMGQAFPF